ncbi:23179_t:CDS:2 [Entrophospora sp. SA101]|nr:23179_t:CDS:2 [Entrophospora sp. SA101]CAJ0845069.1 7999_t:CDS:2 [Entrophospora sp. SA101]CAJ0918283.1 21727_t:CDS:2 [Entrophospora sp. SA101]
MVQAQEYINNLYPVSDRENKVCLNLTNKELEEELNLREFKNLEILICSLNKLTSLDLECSANNLQELDISGCPNIEFLSAYTGNNLPLPQTGSKEISILRRSDISDLKKYLEEYDFSRAGDIQYHKICGSKVTEDKFTMHKKPIDVKGKIIIKPFEILDNTALDNLANKYLARCLIIQNRLIEGENKEYESEINDLAEGYQLCNYMEIRHSPLRLGQKVKEVLEGKDNNSLKSIVSLPYYRRN